MGKSRTLRFAGWIIAVLGFSLITAGLFVYLSGPQLGPTSERVYVNTRTAKIQPSEFIKENYSRAFPNSTVLIPIVQTEVLFDVSESAAIKAFLLTEEQCAELENKTGFSEDIEQFEIGLQDYSFEPEYNVSYVVVVSNIGNETVTCSATMRTSYTFRIFDFSCAFSGLNWALVGGILFSFSFVLENPIERILRRIANLQIFPGVKKYIDPTHVGTSSAWLMLGLVTLAIFVGIYPEVTEIAALNIPDALVPLSQDVVIRLGFFIFLIGLLWVGAYLLVGCFGWNVLKNLLLWLFAVRYNRPYSKELSVLNEGTSKTWRRILLSWKYLIAYVVIGASSVVAFTFTRSVTFVLTIIIVPVAFLFALSMYLTYYQTFDESQLEQMRFFDNVQILTTILVAALFLLFIFSTYDMLLQDIHRATVGSSTAVQIAPGISEYFQEVFSNSYNFLHSLKPVSIAVVEGALVSAFSVFLYLTYFRRSAKVYTRERSVVLREATMFFSTFISVQLVSSIAQQTFALATISSTAVAIGVSLLGAFMRASWKDIVSAPRFCANCRKTLLGLPEEISNCPYCGERINKGVGAEAASSSKKAE
jgi:hypothetical protein